MKGRKTLSALLCAVLLSLCAAGAAADGGIAAVEITMTAPEVGKAQPNDARGAKIPCRLFLLRLLAGETAVTDLITQIKTAG